MTPTPNTAQANPGRAVGAPSVAVNGSFLPTVSCWVKRQQYGKYLPFFARDCYDLGDQSQDGNRRGW